MNFLLFQLKRLLTLPLRIFSSPTELVGSMWGESGRSRALLLGLPAVLFAVVGVGILLWAKFGIADSLENRYLAQLERASEEKQELMVEIRRELRMLQATQKAGAETLKPNELIPADDPRRLALKSINGKEEVYLEKLIDLNPKESDYLFQLAKTALSNGEVMRGLAMMRLIAPRDQPGYLEAHVWMAQYYLRLPAKNQQQASRKVGLAYEQVEQALNRDKNNAQAMKLKADILMAGNRELDVAYNLYRTLFQDDPKLYSSLLLINRRTKNLDRNDAVLDSAIRRFESMLQNESDGDLKIDEVIQVWRDLIRCYVEKKEFELSEEKLLGELKRQESLDGGSGQVWAERMLSNVYVKWADYVINQSPESLRQCLSLLQKSHQYYAENPDTLVKLTQIAYGEDRDLAQVALDTYDGVKDPNAPAMVLSRIGSQALSTGDYDAALKYFEMARKKEPRNSEILNNLAYTYIMGNDPNPKRGLALVDEAIRRVPRMAQRNEYLAHFRETRGQALMQLDRWTDAATEFELALRLRESSNRKFDNKKVLKALIKCYEASGLDPSPYIKRLEITNRRESIENSRSKNSEQDQ